jgi:uncharacterized protein YlxW (UPF0749 family)
MAAGFDPSVTAIVVGAAASLVTLVVSKWLDNSHGDRRDAANARRQEDIERRQELARCQESRELLRDTVSALQADNAGLRATLAANRIPLPPPPLLLHGSGDV